VPKSRIRGAIPPLSQYAFMAWCSVKEITGTNLYVCFNFTQISTLIIHKL